MVGTSAYCISHGKDCYRGAWEFGLERWMLVEDRGEASKKSLELTKDAFCAFSLRARGSVGPSVAHLVVCLPRAPVPTLT